MKRYETLGLLIALVMVATAGMARGEESTSNELARLQATYDTELVKIKTDIKRRQEEFVQKYEAATGVLEQGAKQAGILEKLLAVRKERERFAAGKKVEEADYCTAYPDLLKVQKVFKTGIAGLHMEQARSIVVLAEKYAASLERLKTRLTREGKIDAALSVKQNADDLQKRQELNEARFIIAENESRKVTVAAKQAEVDTSKDVSAKVPSSPAKLNTRESEKSIRKRFVEYFGSLIDGDIDKALLYMDPGFVRVVGTEKLKSFLGQVVPKLQGLKVAGVRLDAGRVDVDEKADEAMNMPRFWGNNKWEYMKEPTYWIRVNNEWYVDWRESRKNKPDDGKQQ
jgi:hypothetical protein